MNTTSRGTTFAVHSVEPATTALPEIEIQESLDEKYEACSFPGLKIVNTWLRKTPYNEVVTAPEMDAYPGHALLQAAYLAFTQHRPLVLSPDILWLSIAQGLAIHINANAEALRPRLGIAHQGRKVLGIQTDRCFSWGDHPWEEYVEGFSQQLKERISPEIHDLFVADFSTTGAVERVASQIALMDGMQPYFAYFLSECGIPYVTLEGTTQDWLDLERRARSLADFGLGWWTMRLVPMLQQFVSASQGDVNPWFWCNLYQQMEPGSRGAYHGPVDTYSGWISVFVPFDRKGRPNPLLMSWNASPGVALAKFRPGVCRAPVVWESRLGRIDLDFLAGLLAIEQHPETLALRPRIGWLVRKAQRPHLN